MRASEANATDLARPVFETTLLDLVWRASAGDGSEQTIVGNVRSLLETGRARLTGNFRGEPIENLFGPHPGDVSDWQGSRHD